MASRDFRVKTLGELCHLFYGRRMRGPSPQGYVVWNGYREIGRSTGYLLLKAEVAITCRGRGGTGSLHMTRPRSGVTDNVIVAQPRSANLDKNYLYWALYASDLTRLVTGSVQHQITIRRLVRHTIPVPRPKEQRFIASTLDVFEQKIKLNQRTMETLKLISESIFKSWFVDFEPVRSNAQNRRTERLADEVSALFPDSFESSLIGEIPKGWTLTGLVNLTKYIGRGITPRYVQRGGVPVITQRCVRGGQIDFDLARRHDAAIRPVVGQELQEGDLLINCSGTTTLGRVAQILHLPGTVVANSRVTVVRPDPAKVTRSFLALAVSMRQEEMKRLAKGTTRQLDLQKNSIGSLSMLVPPLSILNVFESLVLPLRELNFVLQQENRLLVATRDRALSKLIPKGATTHE